MEILAKVLKPKDGGGATAGSSTSADEEQRFLKSLLALRSRDEIARGIRDRLSVLSVLTGEAPSEAVAPQATAAREGAPGAPAATAEDDSVAAGDDSRGGRSLRGVLERLQDGDASGLSPRLLERDFWNALVPELSIAAAETAPPPSAPWHLATAAAATAAATAVAAAAAVVGVAAAAVWAAAASHPEARRSGVWERDPLRDLSDRRRPEARPLEKRDSVPCRSAAAGAFGCHA